MKVELTSLKSEVENIGKTIKISKKAYRWSFQAQILQDATKPNEPNEPELAKFAGQYLVELKDSA
jgi:hypothetical protein